MPLETVEFYCSGGCGWYCYPRLNLELEGEYTIVCGNCKHEHYRYVRKGKIHTPEVDKNGKPVESFSKRITEQRWTRCGSYGERILIMKSACQPKPRKFGSVGRIRQLINAAG